MITQFKLVTSPLHESRLHWIHDPHPNQPSCVTPRQAVPRNNNNPVPRNNHNTVPRNTNTVNNSDAHAQAPLGTIPSASWYNSSLPLPSAPSPRKNVCSRSSRTSSVRVMTTWVILLCWNMGSRPMGLLSSNLTGGRILQFVGKR